MNFNWIVEFVFWYPAMMAMMWVLGSLIFYYSNERKRTLKLESTPFVSILMPAHNEGAVLIPVVEQMTKLNYPAYEIILINDGSTDDTAQVMQALSKKYSCVRVVDLKKNCGKANALYLGLIASKGEILVGVDADSYLDKDALRYMVSHFVNKNNGERVGAVTGNPRVRNRGSLLGKIQLCEYASIISLIKRTQRVLGKVMTVSGVCVAYRKRALLDCGFWDRDMMTEDIAVTWKLEKNFWDVRYEPRALCWMLVPETIKGLWRQRKRWAEGGLEVVFRHWDIFKSWRRRRMTPIYLEQVASFFWSVCWLFLTVLLVVSEIRGEHIYTGLIWKSQFLSFVCLLQFVVAMLLESKYDKDILKSTWSVIWYPILYWYINVFITLSALFKTIFPRKKLATWKSPDRGITQMQKEENRQGNPQVIELPDHENDQEEESHIEYKNNQKTCKKVVGVVLTLIAWIYMLVYFVYMIYGIICDKLNRPVKEFLFYDLNKIRQTEHFFAVLCIATLIELLVLIVWKEYNRRRFGSLRRRTFAPDITNQQIDSYFHLDPELSAVFHNDKYIEIEETPVPEGIGQGRKGIKEHKRLMQEERRRRSAT